jgi:hypothetical protein
VAGNRTLWEEGRHRGRLVGLASSVAALVVVLLNLVGAGQIGLFFDLPFVVICVAAALAIKPTEFFVVGVLPPLLMAGTITVLGVLDRASVANKGDGLVQAVVSGLAHHATALVVGYTLTLAILALRQIATHNAGQLRKQPPRPVERPTTRTAPAPQAPLVPRQAEPARDLQEPRQRTS